MLPRKRQVGGEVVVQDDGEPNLADESPIKKLCTDDCKGTECNSGNINSSSSSSSDKLPIMAMGNNGNSGDIDEDLHSRQLAVYGRETMRRLFASNILVSGMQGLGAEIAKNLVLAGVKSVTLHDEGVVELWDLSGNFFFSEEDIGKNRALACVQKLQELNNAVLISTLTTQLTKEKLSDFQAVVFTDISLDKAIEFDDYCHNHQPPISFIKSEVRGLFGSVFCDFGPEFTVLDVDGEDPHTGIVASISNDNPAMISCVDDERLEFQDGDLVLFTEVHGMTELNDGKPRKIKNARPYSFTIEEDTTNYGAYEKGGIVTQVKQPKVLKFKPLREAVKEPGDFLLIDFSKFDRPPLLHLAFQALDKFISELGRFPVAGSEDDATKFISLVTSINDSSADGKLEEIDQKILRHIAFGARAVLNPMAAMFGGIVGQEVVKACSAKFHPLFQFFYFDSVESLPTEALDPSDLKPLNSRYDAQISVFGAKLQKKLEESKVFTVGSGALGCEFLKNLALMGVACGQNGKLTITDDDVIEKSNLSRQFLFRDWNIGQAKSTVAATAAAQINSRFNIEALQNRASPESENVFDDTFWENLDVVINALDNVNARLYIDQRCLYFQKPLLESGTLGAKCNTQMVIPHLTENYGASRDPPEKQAPMCTVHSFPHNIDHCLTWARSEFEGLLEKVPAEVNAYLTNPSEYTTVMKNAGDAQARNNLESVIECLDKERCETFQDCITWARLKFEDYFSNRVKQLTYTFPEDATTSSGTPFWSAPKRFPRPLVFSVDDLSHLQFILASSILRAETFNIAIPDWVKSTQKFAEAVNNVMVPEFQPKKDVKIVTDEKATIILPASIDDAAVINELVMKLEKCKEQLPPGFKMNPIQFEKDDDTNYHMDVIAGFANMRARNYGIPEVDKLKAKFIAGRIIPAIATSTALATGLVCLELYKVLAGGHKIEDYRNTFANLALPLFSMAEPVPPKVIKHQDMSWTVWDRWIIKNNPTLKQLLNWLKANLLRRVVLHRISFKTAVAAAAFSPDGGFIAVATGKVVQIWRSPGFKKEFFPFELVKTFADCDDKVTALEWSPDSGYVLAGSKDLTARIFCMKKFKLGGVKVKPFMFLGHRDTVVGVFFGIDKNTSKVCRVYTVARDGYVFVWVLCGDDGENEEVVSPGTPEKDGEGNVEGVVVKKRKGYEGNDGELDKEGGYLVNRKWELLKKESFGQASMKVTACDYQRGLDMLVVGFSKGVFALYQMPDFVCIHRLSISREKITTAVFNELGNWLTFGCAKLGQLLVWEWRSESYILKQQGHYFDVNCVAYSPDSQLLATGADDNKVKVWNVSSGFCFVTFSEHENAITALHFLANKNTLLSASLDGTVRAWDFFRYRNFKTYTTAEPRQFVSLTATQSGEVICAGTLDTFEIFVWDMRTGNVKDILSGHEGPVHGLAFSPTDASVLASSSWDRTVRLWDVFESKGGVETLPHTHDVLTVVYRPDGKQLACSTLEGHIHFWDPIDGLLMYTIEGRRDISVGRLMTDRRTAANSSSGKFFTTLCYSADGSYILAGGSSKYICMYDVADQVLLRKFQITHNLSLDGVLDFLNSKNMTDAGPLDLIDNDDSDLEEGVDKQTRGKFGYDLPGSMPNRGRPVVRTKCLRIAPTGRSFSAATTEGVLVYSIDDSFIFDPTDLDMDVTPEGVDAALNEEQVTKALILSLRLNEDSLIKKCIFAVNSIDIPVVASSIPTRYLERLIEVFAHLLEKCPHLEFVLQWCQEICKAHGNSIQQSSQKLKPALISLQKALTRTHQDLASTCDSNECMLRYLCSKRPIENS